MTTKYIKVKEFADRLGINRNTIASAIGRGEINAYKFVGQLMIEEEEFTRYVASCKIEKTKNTNS